MRLVWYGGGPVMIGLLLSIRRVSSFPKVCFVSVLLQIPGCEVYVYGKLFSFCKVSTLRKVMLGESERWYPGVCDGLESCCGKDDGDKRESKRHNGWRRMQCRRHFRLVQDAGQIAVKRLGS